MCLANLDESSVGKTVVADSAIKMQIEDWSVRYTTQCLQ